MADRCRYKLADILFIALYTLLSNGEDFKDMQAFVRERQDWLPDKLSGSNITPSHDTFNRIFQIIDPQQLNEGLAKDRKLRLRSLKGELVSIDGKKQRRVDPTSRSNDGLFILNAWMGKHSLCTGQTKVMEKSNEITAIPTLLDELELSSSNVSIDTMGCQHDIADRIIEQGADYFLAIKVNQGDPVEEVREAFDYGSIRQGYLSPKLSERWAGVRQLVRVTEKRNGGDQNTSQTRYYLRSHEDRANAQIN